MAGADSVFPGNCVRKTSSRGSAYRSKKVTTLDGDPVKSGDRVKYSILEGEYAISKSEAILLSKER
jgi:hypothetical protein